MSAEAGSGQERGLRRELRFWEAIALSIGIMAPGAAMALNGTLPASLVGRAVPLAFVFASVGILFVSYAFIRLTGYFNHAGSAYALSGVTLGPRAGFFSGWALLGTYLAFTAASTAEVGLFGQAFFDGTGIWPNAEWLVISLVAAALIWFIAYGDIRVATRALLTMEGLTVALIVIVVVVIFARVFAGTAPSGQSFTLSPFTPPSGVGLGTVALAAVFGLLSFGGFEGAASLGEETDNPRRNIPRAIATAVMAMGVFYTIVMLAQTLGFGVDKQGTESFAGSSSPLGDLSRSYVGPIMADAINFGVMVSAFASALGTATAGSRMLFALCRDGFLSRRLGETSDRTGVSCQRPGSRHGDRDSCLRGSAHRRRLRGERFLLSGHYRGVEHAGGLHRRERGRPQVPVLEPQGARLGGHIPGDRPRDPGLRDLRKRLPGSGLPVQRLPLRRGGVAGSGVRDRAVRARTGAAHRREPCRAGGASGRGETLDHNPTAVVGYRAT